MTFVRSFFFFKQKTAYDLRISDWSSDVCSSDLPGRAAGDDRLAAVKTRPLGMGILFVDHFELHLSRARFAGRTGACSLSAERRAERRRSSPPIEARVVFSRLSDAGYETGAGPSRTCSYIGKTSCRERVCHYGVISG